MEREIKERNKFKNSGHIHFRESDAEGKGQKVENAIIVF